MYGPNQNVNPYTVVSTGLIVDTNDPQGRGRIKVYCQAYGDLPGTPYENLPWCNYITPFGGMISTNINRGPDDSPTEGSTSYGMWALPKVGSEAVIMCLNGDPASRVFFGCMPPRFMEHTMPHGRHIKDKDGKYSGPLSSTEKPIQPLATNITKAFGTDTTRPEYVSRVTDPGVTGLSDQYIKNKYTESSVADTNSGYKRSRINPERKFTANGDNYDSQIYSMTTPGFHSWSMDDSADNCRIRIRSSCGHNIIIDDTNERIYINTAEGNNWIELDQDGSIDIYASQSISINSDADINLNAKQSIRMHAEDVHVNANHDIVFSSNHVISNSSDVITSTAKTNYYVRSQKTNLRSTKEINTTSDKITTIAKSNCYVQGKVLNLKGTTALKAEGKRATITGTDNLVLSAKTLDAVTTKFNITNKSSLTIKSGAITLGSAAISATSGIIAPKVAASNTKAAIKSAGSVGSTGADVTPVVVDGVVVDPTTTPVTADASGDSAATNLTSAQLAQVLGSISSDVISDTMANMPSEDLGRALTEMSDEVVSNLLSSVGADLFSQVSSNIPTDMLPGILDKINGAAAGSIMQSLPAEDLEGILSQLPSPQLGNILSKIPSAQINDVVDNIPDTNILNDMQSAKLGDMLSNMQSDKLAALLDKMDPNAICNLHPALAGELIARANTEKSTVDANGVAVEQNTVTPKNALKYPNFGRILATRSPDEINSVLANIEPSALGETMSYIPTDKLTVDSTAVQRFDTSKIIPGNFQSTFSSSMTGADVGAKIADLPQDDVNELMNQMTPDQRGQLLTMIPDSGVVLPQVSKFLTSLTDKDKVAVFTSAASMDATEVLNSMTNDEVSQMSAVLPSLSGPDATSVLSDFNNTDVTSLLNNMEPDDVGSMLKDIPINDFTDLIERAPLADLIDVFSNMSPELLGADLARIPDEELNNFLLSMPNETMMSLLDKLSDQDKATILTKMNGPRAATSSAALIAAYPLRIPKHEPWIRSDNKSNTDMTQKYTNNETEIGRTHKTRNKYWSR